MNPVAVRRKRELGIYFALFAMTLTAQDRWEAFRSHPAVQTRIDAARALMGHRREEVAEAVATVAFATLHVLMPGPCRRDHFW